MSKWKRKEKYHDQKELLSLLSSWWKVLQIKEENLNLWRKSSLKLDTQRGKQKKERNVIEKVFL